MLKLRFIVLCIFCVNSQSGERSKESSETKYAIKLESVNGTKTDLTAAEKKKQEEASQRAKLASIRNAVRAEISLMCSWFQQRPGTIEQTIQKRNPTLNSVVKEERCILEKHTLDWVKSNLKGRALAEGWQAVAQQKSAKQDEDDEHLEKFVNSVLDEKARYAESSPRAQLEDMIQQIWEPSCLQELAYCCCCCCRWFSGSTNNADVIVPLKTVHVATTQSSSTSPTITPASGRGSKSSPLSTSVKHK